jgi:hypothetical protein
VNSTGIAVGAGFEAGETFVPVVVRDSGSERG